MKFDSPVISKNTIFVLPFFASSSIIGDIFDFLHTFFPKNSQGKNFLKLNV
jgi:hypothetical protein